VKALMRRAEAYEHVEKFDLALQDVNAVIAAEDTPAAGVCEADAIASFIMTNELCTHCFASVTFAALQYMYNIC
jgi:hypothetical protein